MRYTKWKYSYKQIDVINLATKTLESTDTIIKRKDEICYKISSMIDFKKVGYKFTTAV